MPKKPTVDLSVVDDKLLDGLKFCTKVYDIFEQIRAEPGGLTKIRLLSTPREKKLLEELLPIATYIQSQYRACNRIKVRWLSGSQQYDAITWSPLEMVKKGGVPRKLFVEVTTSVHKHAHYARKLLVEKGGSFGAKGIKINKLTGVPDSVPYVNVNDEGINDLALQIIRRIHDKAQKNYPYNTVLIVNCTADGVVLEAEWNEAIQRVKNTDIHNAFRQVFLIEPTGRHTAELWGGRNRPKRIVAAIKTHDDFD